MKQRPLENEAEVLTTWSLCLICICNYRSINGKLDDAPYKLTLSSR
jgi:hypothetical protein